MDRFNSSSTAVLDMRGGLNSNAPMQFGPQTTLSANENENFLFFDSHNSPSSAFDLGSLTDDFSSFFDSNCLNIQDPSGSADIAGPSLSQDVLLATDSWSGTSNNSNNNNNAAQNSRQGPQSSSPSQCQSSVSQGQVSNLDNGASQQQYGFDKSVWDGTQKDEAQQPKNIVTNVNSNSVPSSSQQKEDVNSQSFSSLHSRQVPMGAMQQPGFQNQAQAQVPSNFHSDYIRPSQVGSSSDLSPRESVSQSAKETAQPMDYEQTHQTINFNGDSRINLQNQHENLEKVAEYQRMDADGQSSMFPTTQSSKVMFQRGSATCQVPNRGQQGGLQGDPVMQKMRSIGFQVQGINNSQLQHHFMNLASQAGVNTPSFSVMVQNQGQNQQQVPSVSHSPGQTQVPNQPTSVNHQAILQARHLLSGSQQSPFPANQQVPFHLIRPSSNQMQQHAVNSGSHLSGIQHFNHIQGRAQHPMFQGTRLGNRQYLQTLPSGPANYACSTNDIGVRSRMPLPAVIRCVETINLYMQGQRKRPQDNSIVFWRKLVQDFYAPVATERWCLSSYMSSPMTKNAQGLLPMEYWFCNICGKQSGRGFEYNTDVLPRLLKIKYDSGLLDELLPLDMPKESYFVPPGKWVVEFSHAVHESVFQELRVVRNGKLRVSFNNSLKILSWEFCCDSHSEFVPRKNLHQHAQQLSNLVKEAEQEGFDKDPSNLKNHCNMFTACAKQLRTKLEAHNIAEVVNSMKDLISYESKTRLGPIESLNRFPTIKKMQAEGLLPSTSLNQAANQLTESSANPNSAYGKMTSRLPLPSRQIMGSSVLQGGDPLLTKVSSNTNPMHVQSRGQLEPGSQNVMQIQANNQMQPPSMSHLENSGQAQPHNGNQFIYPFTQGPSSLQVHPLGQHPSGSAGQMPSQILNGQSQNMSHLSQQAFEQGNKQTNYQQPNQMITQSKSLNRTGQQSLPGTPQSELSDMRSNP
eukprot:TRINITY_DN682_c0_g2_i2.p1 TRINITY_DN682_c0_g2~~TRINITY_DN682_c0_g2_i2.p1  ORF type:complete len:968 (-),score=210.21 TRINITY_DN682_c0_g2_i2:319-3222(-)